MLKYERCANKNGRVDIRIESYAYGVYHLIRLA